MNHQQAWDLLDDFMNEALSAPEMTAVGEHVASCAACREELEHARALRHEAEGLAREIAPPRDLWPAIASAIEKHPPVVPARPARRWLWAAAAATVGVAAIALILVLRPGSPGRPGNPGNPGPLPGPAQGPAAQLVESLEAECQAGEAELARYTDDPKCTESGSIIATFLEEIRTIDTAISEVKAAWTSDPNSPQLVRLLASYYRAKAALQGRATQVASRVSC
jgi:hypothetical protein